MSPYWTVTRPIISILSTMKNHHPMKLKINTFLTYYRKSCDILFDLTWRMVHVLMKIMCILQLLDGMFCRCLLSLFGFEFFFVVLVSLWRKRNPSHWW